MIARGRRGDVSLTLLVTLPLACAAPLVARAQDAVPAADPGRFVESVEVVGRLDLPEYSNAEVITTDAARRAGATAVSDLFVNVLGAAVSRVGLRNETAVFLRGFDLRRVPLFIDGVPVYVPWDGVVDLDRFLLSGADTVIVNKGFGSLIYGPNGLGGTINLVARRPEPGVSGLLSLGAGSDRLRTADLVARYGSARLYGRFDAGYVAAEDFALPRDVVLHDTEDGARRENSDRRDRRVGVTLGLTPGAEDEYALTVSTQRGTKGQPIYAGRDHTVRLRFWRWPRWDKDSAYLRTSTALGGGWSLRGRAFFDQFANTLDAYDDARFETQDRPSSFRSVYDDYSVGASATVGRGGASHAPIAASIGYKRDVHRERTNAGPWSRYDDEIVSLAIEGSRAVAAATELTYALSTDRLRSLQSAHQDASQTDSANGTLALHHRLSGGSSLQFSLARRTRLPTQRDRYSYRQGRSLPNPGLDAETAWHAEAAWRTREQQRISGQLSAFWSRLDDAVEPVFFAPNLFQLQNVGTVEHRGIEARIKARIGATFDVSTDLSLLDRRRVHGPDLPLTEVPPYTAGTTLHWRASDRLSLELRAAREGARDALSDAGNSFRLDGFTLWSCGAQFRLAETWSVEARADNLLDAAVERAEGYPEAGRRARVSIVRRF